MLILSQMVLMLDILEMFLNFHYLTYIRIDENANSEQRQVRRKAFPWFRLAAQRCPPESAFRALGSQSCVRGAVFGPSEHGESASRPGAPAGRQFTCPVTGACAVPGAWWPADAAGG